MSNSFLPIGSVVTINNSEQKLFIVGYKSKIDNTNDVFDYVAYKYPIGKESGNKIIFFNREDIKNIFYQGYVDNECKNFLDNIRANIDIGENYD